MIVNSVIAPISVQLRDVSVYTRTKMFERDLDRGDHPEHRVRLDEAPLRVKHEGQLMYERTAKFAAQDEPDSHEREELDCDEAEQCLDSRCEFVLGHGGEARVIRSIGQV